MSRRLRRFLTVALALALCVAFCPPSAMGEAADNVAHSDESSAESLAVAAEDCPDEVLAPTQDVPDYVIWLLDTARQELGYREGDHGYSKYGEWAGDPYAQWCAEFLNWCVDQVDQQHGTQLLDTVFPRYSGSNTGRRWYIGAGRYIVRNGQLDDWGYQWLKGESSFIRSGSYIPQPGDWVFFTWTDTTDTDHVAMVEYCSRDSAGNVTVHVIEGNNPVAVKRNTYSLTWKRILGYGTVHDLADWTMRFGNKGEKVRALQEKLTYLGFFDGDKVNGSYGDATAAAVRAYQASLGLRQSGIADIRTQTALTKAYDKAVDSNPDTWLVVDED